MAELILTGLRDFAGNPNPPPKLEPAEVTAPEVQGPAREIAVKVPEDVQPSPAAPKMTFQIAQDEDGRRSMFMWQNGIETRLGLVTAPDEVLERVGIKNENTGSIEVPQSIVPELMSGKLPFKDFITAKYRAGEVDVVRSMLGANYLKGVTPKADVLAWGQRELLKSQVGEEPSIAWSRGFGPLAAEALKIPKRELIPGIGRFAIGEAAQLLPLMLDVTREGGKGALILGGGAAAALVIAGGKPNPLILKAVIGLMTIGANVGAFNHILEVEAGSTAMEMLEKGFDEQTVNDLAPLAGVGKAVLEVYGFKFMTAPAKRFFLSKVMGSPPVIKAMTAAYVHYLKTIGVETTTEVMQTKIEQLVNNMGAAIDANPNLLISSEEANAQLLETAIRTLAGVAVIGVPGVALDVAGQKAALAAEKEEVAETTARIEKRKKEATIRAVEAAKAAKVAPVAPVEDVVPLVAPVTPVEGVVPPVEPGKPPVTPAVVPPAPTEEAIVTPEVPVVPSANEVAIALDQFQAGEINLEELTTISNKLVKDLRAATEQERKPPVTRAPRVAPVPLTLEQRTREVQRRGRITALETELRGVEETADLQIQLQESRIQQGRPAARISQIVDRLIVQEQGLREEIERLRTAPLTEVAVTEAERIELKAATVADIVAAGFKEGKRDQRRRSRVVKKIAKENKLTGADIKKLLAGKELGLMSDTQFKNFLAQFKEDVAKVVERKEALGELETVQEDRNLKREENVRELNKLPAVTKMTTAQIREYTKIIFEYDRNDEPLTPKFTEALKTTVFSGAKTMREVLAKGAAWLEVPLEELREGVEIPWTGLLSPDPFLARKGPFFKFIVDQVKMAEEKHAAVFRELEKEIKRLGKKAVKSRERGLAQRLAPKTPEVMRFLEAEPGSEEKIAATAVLTEDELNFAEFLEAAYETAYTYLLSTGDLQSSRFVAKFTFHARKRLPEFFRDIPKTVGTKGIVGAAKELITNWKADHTKFAATDSFGKALGFRKFFKSTLVRTGELIPTENMQQAALNYFELFYRKKALDEAIPTIETLEAAMRSQTLDVSEETQRMQTAMNTFITRYLNTKKGGSILEAVIPPGGVIDTGIRLFSNFISLKFIAFHIPLQISAVVGETAAKVIVMGDRGVIRANLRRLTAKGKRILKKNEGFTGEPFLEEIGDPSRDIMQDLGTMMYGLFQWNRVRTLQDLILGSMTPEEFEAETISDRRLAEIKLNAGRWLDIAGMKSVVGSTSTGAAITKFRGWALPIIFSTLGKIDALRVTLTRGDPKRRLNRQDAVELYRMAEIAVVGYVVAAVADLDEEDDSFTGRTKKYALRELSLVTQALRPTLLLSAGITVAYLDQLAKALDLILTGAEFESEEREGEKKGPPALRRALRFKGVDTVVGLVRLMQGKSIDVDEEDE